MFREVESHLQLAFASYSYGFWQQSKSLGYYDLDWQANIEILGGKPSSSIPFPLSNDETTDSRYKDLTNSRRATIVESAGKLNMDNAIASATKISETQSSDLIYKPQNHRLLFTQTDSPLGKYVALSLLPTLDNDLGSKENQRLELNSINAGTINEVPRGIFKSVLQDATLVDFQTISKNGEDSYFFVKEQMAQSTNDIRALHRLGPRVNLTTHDTRTDNSLTMDVKVHLDNTVFNIRYGTSPSAEKNRLLRHTYKVLARKAWMNEQDLLLAEKLLGDDSKIQLTNYPWNASQKKQLLRNGNVDGFEIAFKRDVQKYSELANSLENVRFVTRKRQPARRRGSNL